MNDLITKHLRIAEAQGKIAPAKSRRSLENYIRKTKKIEPDLWQIHLCTQLETWFWCSRAEKLEEDYQEVVINTESFMETPSGFHIPIRYYEQKRGKGVHVAVHGPPQHGKSIIISQGWPGWIMGYDPTHRFRLATYGITHSKAFSDVVVALLKSEEHAQFFPSDHSRLLSRMNLLRWSTLARRDLKDGHSSFIALGLQSGFVGTGFDTLLMDDPYRSYEEAMSEVIREKCWQFYAGTAHPRCEEHSNEIIMFHRYHQDDQGGRALKEGFDLLRYAAQADGKFHDEETDRTFACMPPGRRRGEYLTPRRSKEYYADQKKNDQIWQSQFQGQPTSKTGQIFDTTLIQAIKACDLPAMVASVRSWDNAATQGGGAFTAGVKQSIDAAENIYIHDVVRDQVGTAERQFLQRDTADKDGKLVEIHFPEDPGAAGKDVAWETDQYFTRLGYTVTVTRAGTAENAAGQRTFGASKVQRAYNASKSVNSRKVFIVMVQEHRKSCAGDEKCLCPWVMPAWSKKFVSELKFFPAGTFKDQVDAFADGHNHLKRLFFRGLVIKNAGRHNLLHRSLFQKRFGEVIPANFDVACGVRVAPDSSKPSGFAITARAPENAGLGETVFIVAAERMFLDNPLDIFVRLRRALRLNCAKGDQHPSVIWFNKGADEIFQTAAQKLGMYLAEFTDDAKAGLIETNWYFQPITRRAAFYENSIQTSRLLAIVDDNQYEEHDLVDEGGMLSLRQDWGTWSFNDQGDPQPFGGITLDCSRMTLYKFALSATELTADERRFAKLDEKLQPQEILKLLGTPEYVEAVLAQEHALKMVRIHDYEDKERELRDAVRNGNTFGPVAVTRRFRRAIG